MTQTQPSIEEIVNEKIILITPSLKMWRGQYELKTDDTEVLLDGKTVDNKDITTPRVRLFTKTGPVDPWNRPWLERLNEMSSDMERVKKKYSLPYNLGVARILPSSRLGHFLEFLFGAYGSPDNPDYGSFAQRLQQIGDEMADQYNDLLSYWSKRDYWSRIEDRVPDKNQVRNRFKVSVGTLNIGLTDGVKSHLLEREASIVAKTCRSQVQDLVASLIEEPRRAIVDECAKLNAVLQTNQKFSERSFNAVREAIEKFRMFEFIADEDVLQKLLELETAVNSTDPKQLGSNADASAALRNAIVDIGAAVRESIERTATSYSLDRSARFVD